jgi:hypothetical protein
MALTVSVLQLLRGINLCKDLTDEEFRRLAKVRLRKAVGVAAEEAVLGRRPLKRVPIVVMMLITRLVGQACQRRAYNEGEPVSRGPELLMVEKGVIELQKGDSEVRPRVKRLYRITSGTENSHIRAGRLTPFLHPGHPAFGGHAHDGFGTGGEEYCDSPGRPCSHVPQSAIKSRLPAKAGLKDVLL